MFFKFLNCLTKCYGESRFETCFGFGFPILFNTILYNRRCMKYRDYCMLYSVLNKYTVRHTVILFISKNIM